MKNILFIAWEDVRNQMRQGSTLLWVFVMPPIFFFFIGTVTGGFSAGMSGAQATPLLVIAESPGFLKEQIEWRLSANDFDPRWIGSREELGDDESPTRTLSFDRNMTEQILSGESVKARYETSAKCVDPRVRGNSHTARAVYNLGGHPGNRGNG